MKDEEVDEFFEGDSETETESEAVEAEDKTEVEEESKVENVSEESDVPRETEPTSDNKPTMVPLAALQDERRKNQQLKEKLETVSRQLPQTDEAPDPFEDIDAYDAFQRQKWEQERLESERQALSQKLNESRSKMFESQADFEEMEKVFEIMTIHDSSLVEKMVSNENPAKFAYDKAKAYMDEVIGSKVEGKTVKQEIETTEKATNVTEMPNLAKATAAASNTNKVEKEDDLEDIFEDQAY